MILPLQKEQTQFSTSFLSQPHTGCGCPSMPKTFPSSSCYSGLSPQLPPSHHVATAQLY